MNETATKSNVILDIPLDIIVSASISNNFMMVDYWDLQQEILNRIVIKFSYRNDDKFALKILTEFHTFYMCRNVNEDIQNRQTIMRPFNVLDAIYHRYPVRLNTRKYKHYMFDVRYTRRDVYDISRKTLESFSCDTSNSKDDEE
ncbi:hypothetical protein RF11_07824 [Thelohanellus kitauei]|uniref:Uncharacterized protein n=1 Tax=Thelohanellus kitauei TaxID=669202 RepID=A0A0C2IPM8_THEKT|nr:hypothetical protein RF11_07824 [Thelohanellus kitauei]